jgi:hypothetical protein
MTTICASSDLDSNKPSRIFSLLYKKKDRSNKLYMSVYVFHIFGRNDVDTRYGVSAVVL